MDTAGAREMQETLRSRRIDELSPGFAPRLVAGADLSMARKARRGYAAVVVLDLESLEVAEEVGAEAPLTFPYVPGLLSFRELPPLARAWERLETRPDVVIFDAHGVAHPRRFGLASHGGVLFDVPSVGCAKNLLVGEHPPLAEGRGATAPVTHDGEVIGAAVRTRSGVRPVYASVGHRMDLETAVALVLRTAPRYRIPEPIRHSHRLANRLRREGASS